MSCFCCNQGLQNWDDYEEPWTEHARWSPTCTYVLLSKGEDFIKEALGLKNVDPKSQDKVRQISQEDRIFQVNSTKMYVLFWYKY